MDKINNQILQELKATNKLLSDIFIFLLAREGYTKPQIRTVFGKMDNDRVRRVIVGLKNKAE